MKPRLIHRFLQSTELYPKVVKAHAVADLDFVMAKYHFWGIVYDTLNDPHYIYKLDLRSVRRLKPYKLVEPTTYFAPS